MIDMEVKATDSINWAELTRQLAQRMTTMPSAAPGAAAAGLPCRHSVRSACDPGARLKETRACERAVGQPHTAARGIGGAACRGNSGARSMTGCVSAGLAGATCASLYELRGTLEAMARSWRRENATKPERQVIGSICEAEAALIELTGRPPNAGAPQPAVPQRHPAGGGNRFLSESLERLSRLMVLLGATAYSLARASRRRSASSMRHDQRQPIRLTRCRGASNAMHAHLDSRAPGAAELLSLTASTELTEMGSAPSRSSHERGC